QVQQVEEGQTQRNTKEAREFLQQIKKSKVFWASFGAMKEQDDRIVDEKWRTSTLKIAEKALGELNRFIASPMLKGIDSEKFSKDFVTLRKLYGFQDSFRVASALASEWQDAENERLKRKKEPPAWRPLAPPKDEPGHLGPPY
ncbi:MAG TPA: hypothetical protein VHV10_08980, partial [Ktedonobacteraceae bacterium]|nr:hypothetical protein [Ktedonobacteraceae bacterium]